LAKITLGKNLLAFRLPAWNWKNEQLFVLCLGVYSLLTPRLNTLSQKDLSKNILDSIKNGGGVKVFSGFLGDKNKISRIQLAPSPSAISEAPSTAETADSAPDSSADPIFPGNS